MKFRKSILPKNALDFIGTVGFSGVIILIYCFEVLIVLPNYFAINSCLYWLNILIATFFLFNILGNKAAIILIDTSISGQKLTPSNSEIEKYWDKCTECETIRPPRSWHCKYCHTCILSRDHHCVYVGCCVGHNNYRFFIMLLSYLCVATLYASIYNNIFIWITYGDLFWVPSTLLQIVFPLGHLIFDPCWENWYFLAYLVCGATCLFIGFLLHFHATNIYRGMLTNGQGKFRVSYNLGWRRNALLVFGNRWRLCWLSPLIQSELPYDGINWEDVLRESSKNR